MGDKSLRYGLDEYSRYVERDGERYCIEPWPYWWPFTPRLVAYHILARWDIIKWFWATRHRRHLWKY